MHSLRGVIISMITDKRGEFFFTGFEISIDHDITFGYVSSDLPKVVENGSSSCFPTGCWLNINENIYINILNFCINNTKLHIKS